MSRLRPPWCPRWLALVGYTVALLNWAAVLRLLPSSWALPCLAGVVVVLVLVALYERRARVGGWP